MLRASSSSNARSHRRRSAAMSPATALLLLHGISGTTADSTVNDNNFRLFSARINMVDYVASQSQNTTSAAVKVTRTTVQPSAVPTALPTVEPTPLPTHEPTPLPTTAEPTPLPTAEPTPLPTVEPTSLPTVKPTPLPTTAEPTPLPTAEPTPLPTVEPTPLPTAEPTPLPTTAEPTPLPTVEPTTLPTAEPTPLPTTAEPTLLPTVEPTALPTAEPTPLPTVELTPLPTTAEPTPSPTVEPTPLPTTAEPTALPTAEPTPLPTTAEPTPSPSVEPTNLPTSQPTTAEPTSMPTPLRTASNIQSPTSTAPLPVTAQPTAKPTQLKEIKFVANPPRAPLGECEGDCDNNNQCAGDLICYQRKGNEDVPGCTGGRSDSSRTDYCIRSPSDAAISTLSSRTSVLKVPTPTLLPTPAPTAKPSPAQVAQAAQKEVKFIRWTPRAPLGECEGDCDGDHQCAGDLICHQRDANEEVPGCTGGGSDNKVTDYCIRPATDATISTTSSSPTPLPHTSVASVSPTPTPTPLPTPAPTAKPSPAQVAQAVQKEVKFIRWTPRAPLGECEGDCDNDNECAGDLVCHQRDANEEVPRCTGGGSDNKATDYCIRPAANTAADTDSPTISSSPTPLPTISYMPSVSSVPSVQPSLNPTPAPNSVSEKFRLRLYWHESYYWQETRMETFWCWQCRGGCKAGNLIEIDHCRNADYFQFYGEDNSYRPASNPNLCVTEHGCTIRKLMRGCSFDVVRSRGKIQLHSGLRIRGKTRRD
eukprot:scaffold26655_cov153-Skeletonema_menzelii.AAC.3